MSRGSTNCSRGSQFACLIDLCPGRSLPRSCQLQQLYNPKCVHVCVDLVFSAHAPTEGVAGGSNAGMNRPAGRDCHLLVGDDKMPSLLGRSHHVDDTMI